MAVYKCKMCGGDLNIEEGVSVVECEFCGSRQTVPTADNEKKMTLFGRANRLRLANEFDKAAGVYEQIVSEFPEEAEAYWGLFLCKYGIEYVDDPATGKKIPTCHRSSFESALEDTDFEQACENADAVARREYREEAKVIEGLRSRIIEVSSKEEPYDIFISYKDRDENNDRTIDSVIAQDVYDALTEKGYRVFFSRISLENKLGTEYEPYIFAALNSAKVMLVFGTDYENFNAVWVKNEWSRFLALIAAGQKKVLIPCYKDIDAYDMPKEFKKLSAQDMGKVGAMQDLLRGIDKIFYNKGSKEPQAKETVAVQQSNSNSAALLERAFMFLEDKKWQEADEYCERVLDMEPRNAEAYLGKLMAQFRCSQRSDLKDVQEPFSSSDNFRKVMRFGEEALKAEIKGYNDDIIERNEKAAKEAAENRKKTLQSEREKLVTELKSLDPNINTVTDRVNIQAEINDTMKEVTDLRLKIEGLKSSYGVNQQNKQEIDRLTKERDTKAEHMSLLFLKLSNLSGEEYNKKRIEKKQSDLVEQISIIDEEIKKCELNGSSERQKTEKT